MENSNKEIELFIAYQNKAKIMDMYETSVSGEKEELEQEDAVLNSCIKYSNFITIWLYFYICKRGSQRESRRKKEQ